MDNIIKTSVRNLIEFVMRSGDIDNSYISQKRAIQGIQAHQKLQKEYGDNYQKEYFLRNESLVGDMVFVVEGRADGIIFEEDSVVIDEIKSTTRNLDLIEKDYNPLHWAQAKCYGYFYAVENKLEELTIQLSYYNIEDEATKRFRETFTLESLWEFYEDLLKKYLDFSILLKELREARNKSIENLPFPYPNYRKGQRELAANVYKTILGGGKLFVEAPTGIGKTMSTLFPAIKTMTGGNTDKIFYLTARSTTKKTCADAVEELKKKGLSMRTVVFTSKEKSCINEKVSCNPKDCIYAKGHFDRVNEAIEDILANEELIDYDTILEYAAKYRVCPFEFQLDLGLYSDLVVCDYNYAFDPKVYLRRFFDNPFESYVFLVDEAHNLIDRGRAMFSQEIRQKDLIDIVEDFYDDYLPIRKSVSKLISKMEEYRKDLGDDDYLCKKEEEEDIFYMVRNLTSKLDTYLSEEKERQEYDKILNVYFELTSYLRISELYFEGYRTIFSLDEEEKMTVKLLCIDTSKLFRDILLRAKSTIMFSATMTPINFYLDLLGGDEKTYRYHLGSPFNPRKLYIGVMANISTRYKNRLESVGQITKAVYEFTKNQAGNYLVFFPSYSYMDQVHKKFLRDYKDQNVIIQDKGMTEAQRDDFLNLFQKGENLTAFAVLGGVFSEGIDLVGDRLTGAVIVSVGLPGLSHERNVIRDYFNEKNSMGYEYAYIFPGMNKVLQAAGRVIRTEEDKGAILLIDDRFAKKDYRILMPKHWSHLVNHFDYTSLERDLYNFWSSESIEEEKIDQEVNK